jgi:hypothetical protein
MADDFPRHEPTAQTINPLGIGTQRGYSASWLWIFERLPSDPEAVLDEILSECAKALQAKYGNAEAA